MATNDPYEVKPAATASEIDWSNAPLLLRNWDKRT
jgi:hypothetical protein